MDQHVSRGLEDTHSVVVRRVTLNVSKTRFFLSNSSFILKFLC